MVSKGASLSGVEKDTERLSILVLFCFVLLFFAVVRKYSGKSNYSGKGSISDSSSRLQAIAIEATTEKLEAVTHIYSQKTATMNTRMLISSLLSRLLCSLDPLPGEQFHPQRVGLLISIKVVCWVAKPSANIVVNANYSQ